MASGTEAGPWLRDPNVLLRGSIACFPNLSFLSPIYAPGEWISPPDHILLPRLSEPPHVSSYFSRKFLCILQNPAQIHLCESFPRSPGRAVCSLFLLVGRAFWVCTDSILLNAGCTCLQCWPEMNYPRHSQCSLYSCIPEAQRSEQQIIGT